MAKLGSRASFGGTVVEKITAAKTLDPSDSGKVFTLDTSGGNFTVTLPTVANAGVGWNCKFIVSTTGAICTIQPSGAETSLIGMITVITDDVGETSESGVDELKFLAAAAAGDNASLICDGTNYFVSGTAHANDHMSIA
tara:strand:- start:1282 stop:1698 length:417 start_codon:yes stop_codon:yes gene_type:complete